jgi:acyl-CoA thioesterase
MHLFDEDIVLEEIDPMLFKGTVSDNWSVHTIPNGGYLMAMMAHAMMKRSEKRSTPIITANFVQRGVSGEAEISVEQISQSTQFDRMQAKLTQQGKERVRAMGTFARNEAGNQEKRYESKEPDMPGPEACVRIPETPEYTLYTGLDVRLDPACTGWMAGNLSDKSEQKGWIKFTDDRAFDTLSLLLLADAFPPPVLASHGLVAWVPTIEFSMNIRNVPTTRWLKCVFRTHFINNGLVDEDGQIWDENGDLAAISRQIAQYRKQG